MSNKKVNTKSFHCTDKIEYLNRNNIENFKYFPFLYSFS